MIKEGRGLHKELVIALVFVFAIGIGIGIYSSNTGYEGNSVTAKLVAVADNGEGVLADVVASVKEGNGLVLVNVNNAVADHDTQVSARRAAKVASDITGISLDNLDILYNIKSSAARVSGASAGTPMAIATIAALEKKQVKDDVAITGVINDGGFVSAVGSIPEKAQAAKDFGMRMLLVPSGSNIQTIEYRRERRCSTYDEKEFCEITYRDSINSDGYALELKEISNIKEALPYFLE